MTPTLGMKNVLQALKNEKYRAASLSHSNFFLTAEIPQISLEFLLSYPGNVKIWPRIQRG